MENLIIILIVAAVIAIGVVFAAKHFSGKGGCCGGGGYKPKKKKLTNVLYEKNFLIDGMHCDHCKARVEEVINDMKGLAGRVDLKKGELTVFYAEDIPDELIAARLARAGYPIKKTVKE